jgi:DNA-binding SARP family transcriptional activator
VHILSAKQDVLLKKAAQLYDNEEFVAAKILYDSLYRMGEYDKNILERLVDISEKNNQQAEAIYFLRKIEQDYGGQEVEKRINTLG